MHILSLVIVIGAYGIQSDENIFAYEHDDTYSYDSVWQNSQTGYEVYIDDWADLLTPSEETQLLEVMKEISAYGNVSFVSISENDYYSTERYAEHYYYEHFEYDSGTLFLVDMDYRYLWIYSDGAIYDTVTISYANTITDNVYTYASDEDYYTCADTAFGQILRLLQGQRIAQPMKYISNALLALVLALLINYFFVMFVSRSKKATAKQLLSGTYTKVDIKNARADFIRQTRRHSPRNTGGSGGGGSSSRSSGGGGGSRGGGGGGGHRF